MAQGTENYYYETRRRICVQTRFACACSGITAGSEWKTSVGAVPRLAATRVEAQPRLPRHDGKTEKRPGYPRQGGRASACSKSARVCTGSPWETMTISNGSSSSARKAGNVRCSCHGVAQTRNSPAFCGAVSASAKTIARCSGSHTGVSPRPRPSVLRHEAAGQNGPRFDRVQLGFRNVVAKIESRSKPSRLIANDEAIDVADMIRLQDDGGGGPTRFQPRPKLRRVLGRRVGIEDEDFAA